MELMAHAMDKQIRIQCQIDLQKRLMQSFEQDERYARTKKMDCVQRINALEREMMDLAPGL